MDRKHYNGHIGDFDLPPIGTDKWGNPLVSVNVMKYYNVSELPEANEMTHKRMALVNDGTEDKLYICLKRGNTYEWIEVMAAAESSESEAEVEEIKKEVEQIIADLSNYVTHPELEEALDPKADKTALEELQKVVDILVGILDSEGVFPDPTPLTDLITRQELDIKLEDYIADPETKSEGQVLTYEGDEWVAKSLPEYRVPVLRRESAIINGNNNDTEFFDITIEGVPEERILNFYYNGVKCTAIEGRDASTTEDLEYIIQTHAPGQLVIGVITKFDTPMSDTDKLEIEAMWVE